jgi:membrane-associated protein
MEQIKFLIDLFLHLDEYMSSIISQYGTWTYGILFVVIFVETGLVVMPFLPGD